MGPPVAIKGAQGPPPQLHGVQGTTPQLKGAQGTPPQLQGAQGPPPQLQGAQGTPPQLQGVPPPSSSTPNEIWTFKYLFFWAFGLQFGAFRTCYGPRGDF